MTPFQDRLSIVEDRIASACRRAGRARSEVQLMAVSKTRPASAMEEAVAAGLTLFGENRVQEFDGKRTELKSNVEIHLIGHLQSNKASKAVEIFSAIDTVDSLKLAIRLNDAAATVGRRLPVLLEIKLSGEGTKTGFDPAGVELRSLLDRVPDLSHLEVQGLMTVAPLDENSEAARSCFRSLRALRDELSRTYPSLNLEELSMGMSGDFEAAIEEGSTLVRIGTALFGARSPQP